MFRALCSEIPWAANRGVAGWSLEDDILFLPLAQATLRYVGKNFQDTRVRNEPHPLLVLAAGASLEPSVAHRIVAHGEHFVGSAVSMRPVLYLLRRMSSVSYFS